MGSWNVLKTVYCTFFLYFFYLFNSIKSLYLRNIYVSASARWCHQDPQQPQLVVPSLLQLHSWDQLWYFGCSRWSSWCIFFTSFTSAIVWHEFARNAWSISSGLNQSMGNGGLNSGNSHSGSSQHGGLSSGPEFDALSTSANECAFTPSAASFAQLNSGNFGLSCQVQS